MRTIWVWSAGLALFALAACTAPAASPTPAPTVPATPTVLAALTPTPGQTRGAPDAARPTGGSAMVDLARQDLARRLGLSPDQIVVESVKEREWPDTSLGCPEPGRLYAQVIVPGYRIVLRAQDRTFVYHTDRTSRVVLCQRP